MGRQFSYYCLPKDLDNIQARVFVPMGGRLFIAEKRDSAHKLVPADRFALDLERMGQETLFLLLLPPEPISKVALMGPWIDHAESHVIEVGRCYTDGSILRSARFWYEARMIRDCAFTDKPREFVSWAEAVFRKTKVLLERQTVTYYQTPVTEWFGEQAWAEVSSGRLRPSFS
jgi:hypothetical protein